MKLGIFQLCYSGFAVGFIAPAFPKVQSILREIAMSAGFSFWISHVFYMDTILALSKPNFGGNAISTEVFQVVAWNRMTTVRIHAFGVLLVSDLR